MIDEPDVAASPGPVLQVAERTCHLQPDPDSPVCGAPAVFDAIVTCRGTDPHPEPLALCVQHKRQIDAGMILCFDCEPRTVAVLAGLVAQ